MIDIFELEKQYKKYFGNDAKPKLDGIMTRVLGRPVLDMYELEYLLHSKHGQYEEKNMSTQDLIKNNYGESCLLFVKKALGLEGDR